MRMGGRAQVTREFPGIVDYCWQIGALRGPTQLVGDFAGRRDERSWVAFAARS